MKKVVLFAGIMAFALQNASAQLIESWENTLDGWTVQQGAYTPSFVTAPGVTDGTYSLALTGTASPTYGQMVRGPSSMAMTTLLANSATLQLDVYAPAGSFGGFLQFDFDVNNNDTGFVSLDSFSYPAANLGSETTFTLNIPASLNATLSASLNPTQVIIQVGGGSSAGNETMYLDNLRVTPVPEPGTMALMAVGFAGLLAIRRRAS